MNDLISAFLDGIKPKKPGRTVDLTTPWSDQPALPWDCYPRPMLVRDSFFCLNGPWDLSCNGAPWGAILVPYPVESQLSGIGRPLSPGDVLTYTRNFTLPAGFRRDRVLLHFGAVDQVCSVFLNGQLLGTHEGGYLNFSFDITAALAEGENTLRVEVRDDLDHDLPWGKQSQTRGGMWYTPVSGIWQTVWLESVPERYIQSITISSDMTSATIVVRGGGDDLFLNCDGKRYALSGGRVTIRPETPRLWSPESPNLYPFTLSDGTDMVRSYFALRQFSTQVIGGIPRLTLNGKPYFFHGLLDQGYYPDGIYLPGAPAGYTFDVQKMKDLGFNTLRKHIKVEPEQFYYDCDRLGMVVFQDFVNSGDYYYWQDTALPTVGFKAKHHHPAPSPHRKSFFLAHGEGIVAQLRNHPSLLGFTIFNEGWGQHDSQDTYRHFKALYPQFLWNAASGWFQDSDSDLQSEHIYFGDLKLRPRRKKPLALTEFGGYSWPVEGHRFNLDEEFGYQKYSDPESFQDALTTLYREKILPQIADGLCMSILTQVSDVEDETNGLVTYDRRVVKASPAVMSAIARELRAAMAESDAFAQSV